MSFARLAIVLTLVLPGVSLAEPKIGAIVSLTGPAAENGKHWFEGSQLAAESTENPKVGFVFEDDRSTAVGVAAAFQKLSQVDHVSGMVGGTWDFLAEAAAPLVRRSGIPFITPTNPLEVLSPEARAVPNFFTNALTLEAEEQAVQTFVARHHVKTAALVIVDVPYGTLHADMVAHLLANENGSITVKKTVTYQGFNDDIKGAVLEISRVKPDLVFTVLNYEGVDLLAKELEKRSLAPLILMTYTLDEAIAFSKSPERYRNAFGIFPKVADPAFVRRFESRFGASPNPYAAAGYDAFRFMARLLDARSRHETAFEFAGVLGKLAFPGRGALVGNANAAILRSQDGRLVEDDKS